MAPSISSFKVTETLSQEARPKWQQHTGKLWKDKVRSLNDPQEPERGKQTELLFVQRGALQETMMGVSAALLTELASVN